MSGQKNNVLLLPISMIVTQLENQCKITIFDGPPDGLAPLPNELGGHPAQWPALEAAAASGRVGFFALLAAKAHYLMLPKAIITGLDTWRLMLSEMRPSDGDVGQTTPYGPEPLVEIRIARMSNLLAQAGFGFGQSLGMPNSPEYYDILSTIYHEMTHAWFFLRKFAGADLQDLYARGVAAYGSARDSKSNPVDAELAFTEAAAYYVDDRVQRWGEALNSLDALARAKPSDRTQARVVSILFAFDNYVPVYGKVDSGDIVSPALSPELRDAINATILEGLPLTKNFDDTPLAAVGAALVGS